MSTCTNIYKYIYTMQYNVGQTYKNTDNWCNIVVKLLNYTDFISRTLINMNNLHREKKILNPKLQTMKMSKAIH